MRVFVSSCVCVHVWMCFWASERVCVHTKYINIYFRMSVWPIERKKKKNSNGVYVKKYLNVCFVFLCASFLCSSFEFQTSFISLAYFFSFRLFFFSFLSLTYIFFGIFNTHSPSCLLIFPMTVCARARTHASIRATE